MSRHTKLQRYAEITRLPNVTELNHYREGHFAPIRGNWSSVFGNNRPVTLELACGKGEYALALAAEYPDRNFVGVDIKGDRLWKGAHRALDSGLTNVHFLRARIDHLCNYFAPNEVEELWITFPDPYPKKPRKRKRLTHPVFLKRYAGIMRPDGLIHLKTDDQHFFNFTLSIIDIFNLPVSQQIFDVYQLQDIPKHLDIRTYYEEKHLDKGLTIKYVAFGLNEAVKGPIPDAVQYLT